MNVALYCSHPREKAANVSAGSTKAAKLSHWIKLKFPCSSKFPLQANRNGTLCLCNSHWTIYIDFGAGSIRTHAEFHHFSSMLVNFQRALNNDANSLIPCQFALMNWHAWHTASKILYSICEIQYNLWKWLCAPSYSVCVRVLTRVSDFDVNYCWCLNKLIQLKQRRFYSIKNDN